MSNFNFVSLRYFGACCPTPCPESSYVPNSKSAAVGIFNNYLQLSNAILFGNNFLDLLFSQVSSFTSTKYLSCFKNNPGISI